MNQPTTYDLDAFAAFFALTNNPMVDPVRQMALLMALRSIDKKAEAEGKVTTYLYLSEALIGRGLPLTYAEAYTVVDHLTNQTNNNLEA